MIANKTDKRVASLILRAQNASDGGKGIDLLVNSQRSTTDNSRGYETKDMAIRSRIT